MIRVDMRCNSNGWYYIEVNDNPGKNRFSYLTVAAYSLGLQYPEIIAWTPYEAMCRYGLKPPGKLQGLVRRVVDIFDAGATR